MGTDIYTLNAAMACGTPVVTSNSSALAEVAGDNALLVNPLSVSEIAGALHRLHKDPDLRQELRRRGLSRAAEFTWERLARSTLDLYEDVVGRAKSPGTREAGVSPDS